MQVIIKDMRQSQDFSFFIMSGNCHVVRQIPVVVERLPFGKEKISLASVDEDDEVKKNMKIDGRYERFKNLYLVIQSLKEGQYFGVDEDIGKSSVITVTKVIAIYCFSCLLSCGRMFSDFHDRIIDLSSIVDHFY